MFRKAVNFIGAYELTKNSYRKLVRNIVILSFSIFTMNEWLVFQRLNVRMTPAPGVIRKAAQQLNRTKSETVFVKTTS